jgi:hypothetical protein
LVLALALGVVDFTVHAVIGPGEAVPDARRGVSQNWQSLDAVLELLRSDADCRETCGEDECRELHCGRKTF